MRLNACMNALVFMIPLALLMGFAGLVAFIWALKSGQFDDPEGAANRILLEDEPTSGETPPPAPSVTPRKASRK